MSEPTLQMLGIRLLFAFQSILVATTKECIVMQIRPGIIHMSLHLSNKCQPLPCLIAIEMGIQMFAHYTPTSTYLGLCM